ncbi:MAG: ComF family protein [Candidatus Uhrbacteria bacterium]|nr:ComF family protein [Candidatus Uhrbacteria bacterium]
MSRFSRLILDLVFPPACVVCRSRGFWVCPDCLDSVRIEKIERELAGLDRVTSLGTYATPALRKMITGFKYQSATCLEPSFIELLRHYKAVHGAMEAATIVPVPSSEERILERGFDHVTRLAELIRRELAPNAEIGNVLRRAKQSLSNADLEDHAARRGNVMGSFEIVGDVPERVLLVDDVVTSGATAGECAKLLREKGAKEVSLFTMASGG